MIHNSIKLLAGLIALLGLSGCGGTSPSTEAKQTLKTAKGYKVGALNVTLAKHFLYDFSEEEKQYPNEKELALFFKKDIEKYLKKAGRSCESTPSCLTLDLDINYLRNFNMGSVSVSAPTIDRTLTIRKGDTVVYNNTKKELKPNKGGIVGNTLNELAMFTKAGDERANVADERKDIQVISQVTVNDIVQLAQ